MDIMLGSFGYHIDIFVLKIDLEVLNITKCAGRQQNYNKFGMVFEIDFNEFVFFDTILISRLFSHYF